VKFCPCQDQLLLPSGQIAVNDFAHANVHRCLILVVVDVEMRWTVRSRHIGNTLVQGHR
jgi:hypothetical protein